MLEYDKSLSIQIYDKGIELGIPTHIIYNVVIHAVSSKYNPTTDIGIMLSICNYYKDLFEYDGSLHIDTRLKCCTEKLYDSLFVVNNLKKELSYAQTAFGIMYYKEYDGATYYNREKSVELFKLAIKYNNPVALYYLGNHYIEQNNGMAEEGIRLINMSFLYNESDSAFFLNKSANYIKFVLDINQYKEHKYMLFNTYISRIELKLVEALDAYSIVKTDTKNILTESSKIANEIVSRAYAEFNNEFVFDVSILFENTECIFSN